MKTIAEETLEKVRDGARFSIDFKTRTMKVDGKVIIDKGKHEGILWYLHGVSPIGVLEILYDAYKHSVPSERSESRSRNYFAALKEKDLSDDDMMYGEPREEARFNLEFAMLAFIIEGKLVWKEEWGSYFWQSEKDKDFIILRQWVEGK